MSSYYRVMLGRGSKFSKQCFKGGFIGTDFAIKEDLTGRLPEDWRQFNAEFRPIFLAAFPEKSKISAGLACGALWTVAKGINPGDTVLCPSGDGYYRVGEVVGEYVYCPGDILQHRRNVTWYDKSIARADMSEALKASTGTPGTVSRVDEYASELETLIGGQRPPRLISTDATVEDPVVFALEKHLEEFLVKNWGQTELGVKYDIYEEDGEKTGQQFDTGSGKMDILAISKDKKEILVVELKKGRASDSVVGQIQRYMGYAVEELAEEGQKVRGVIIAHEDSLNIRRALLVARDIEFYRYEVSFRLSKV